MGTETPDNGPKPFSLLRGVAKLVGAGMHLLLLNVVLLHPHLAQDLYRRYFPQPHRGAVGVDSRQQMVAIAPDALSQPCALRLLLGQAVLLKI